jgi:hypothetical protein
MLPTPLGGAPLSGHDARPALHDGAVEEASRQRRGVEQADADAAARLAKESDALGVAAKGARVRLDL